MGQENTKLVSIKDKERVLDGNCKEVIRNVV